jgi:hypothetical protein
VAEFFKDAPKEGCFTNDEISSKLTLHACAETHAGIYVKCPCSGLIRTVMCQILIKYRSVKFNENLFSGSIVVTHGYVDGQTQTWRS